jgi:uncharacterized lipoprotein YmbA
MTQRAFAGLLGALVLSLALGACSSPDPELYTIAPVSGAVKAMGPQIIVIDRVVIAKYLDRSQIVQSSEDYRVDLKSNDWCAEAPGAMLRRVLQQELAQRLPRSSILSETGAISATPDATIDIDFQRLDENKTGSVVLQAQASVSFKNSKTPIVRSFNFTVPSTVPGVAGEVAAISAAVGQLADGLVALLAPR